MSLRINQNIDAFNSYRNLSVTQGQMSKSLEKLSSGFRINRAADDAAGLAISEGLRSQVGGLKVAARNAQDGISVVQTTEGALTEVHSILQRLRDLGVQGASDSNNAQARGNIKTEADSLVAELGRISQSTNFNGKSLLNGAGKMNFQVGADGNTNSLIEVDLAGANVAGVSGRLKTSSQSGTTFALNATAPGPAAYSGAQTMNFSVTEGGVVKNVAVTLAAAGTPADRDSATEFVAALNADATFNAHLSASLVHNEDGAVTGVTVSSNTGGTVGNVGAGTSPNAALFGATNAGTVSPTGTGLDFSNTVSAQTSIKLIDAEIQKISTARAQLGAYQNRFEHTINNLNVAVENLSASESRIRDTDMASEMMNFTRAQILSQAGTAMLAQANQAPQGVLQLLR